MLYKMNNKKITLIIIVALIIIISAGFYLWQKYYKIQSGTPQTLGDILGGEIFEQMRNPIEKIPQSNPYKAKTNIFEEVKTNPFKDIYKNPFAK